MRLGLYKNRFFGSGGAGKKRCIPIWIAMVWVGMGMGFANQGFAQVRISQAYGGGGNSGATLKNDFIELYNAGAATVSLSGWSIQYASAATSTGNYVVTTLSGSIGPKKYYLIQQAAGAGGTQNLPTPDATGTIGMTATGFRLALVSNATALAVTSSANALGIIDFVGASSTASTYEGTGPAPAPSNTTAILRKDGGETDTDNNSSDFTSTTPNPRNSASSVNPSIATSATSLNQFSATAGSASDPQSFTVLGFGLTTTISVTIPSGFEISADSVSYSTSLSLPSGGGTIYVRIPASATSGSSPSGNITLASSPALSRTVAVSGAVTAANSPAVSCSPTALTGFSTYAGSVSTAQTITVSGTYLIDSVVVTAASGYEVSSDNITFSSSVSITQSGGTLGGTPVYVRVAGTASVGPLSGNAASVSSIGSPVVNVSGSGTVSTPFLTLLLSPNPVNEGVSSTGTVSIPQARVADLAISLASANPSAVTVPLSVTIPAGSTSATFQTTALDIPSSYAETSSSISVSATGVTGASVMLTVNNSTPAPITPISLDGSNSNSYSQNFDGLGTSLVSKVIPGSNGVSVSLGAVTSTNLNGWYATKNSGTGTVATDISTNTNSSTGTLYNFGALGNSDRSLGGIATATTAVSFGALITNTTGGTIANLKLSLKGEFWRSSTGPSNNVLTFGYGKINGTTVNTSNFLTVSSNIFSLVGLNINGPAPVAASGSSNGPLDGNEPANQVTLSSVSIPLILQAGESAFLRWADVKEGSYDAGLSIDDFVLTYDVDRTLTLTSFSPAVGPVATQVTIRGSNFSDGIPVRFNGTAATLVSVISPTELAVTVPEGATTGYITVGEGSAAVTSATAFVVGNFSGDPTVSGTNFGNVSVGSVADKYMMLNGGGLPGLTLDLAFDQPDFLLSEDGSNFASTLSVSLSNGSVSYVFPALRFAPMSTGVKTAVLTISSSGIVIGKYTFTGAGAGLAQPTYFAGFGQSGRASLYWGPDPSYDLVILGKEGSSVADAPSASGSYTGNTTFGSGTSVGSSTTIFSGLDSSVSNTVVTGLRNNQFTYFKIFNRNPSTSVVSVGKEIRVMPYADITSGVITRWNFNNSDLSASTGSGMVEAVGGVAAGFVNGVGGSSDRATINKAVSVKGATGQFTGLQFAVSTVGKKEVKVFWDIAASGSASKFTRFQYTLDVTATPPVWVDYSPALQDSPGVTPVGGLYVLDVADSTLLQRSADLSSVSGIENNAKFGFRVVTANAPGTSAIARADGTSAAYSTVGTVKYDMVTVTGASMQAQTPFESWVAGYPTLTGANALGTADPDGDGMINSAEFAFGTSPVSGASRAVTQTSVTGGIKITWLQRSGVTYEVKSTDNLGSAFSVPVSSNLVSPQPDGLGDYQQYEATLTGGDRGFIKVEAFVP